MFDINALPLKKQFTKRLIRPDTWIINPWDENNAAPHPHVVIGSEKALVIDSTWTELDVRSYIEQYVTDKPIELACSHGHADHTNANWRFEGLPIYMSEYAWNEIKARRDMEDQTAARWMGNKPGTYQPTILNPGDKIELGDRTIEVLPYGGCHSLGSLMYLDHKYGILFTGDEIECGQMLVNGNRNSVTCVERLYESLKELVDGWGDEITMLCPPHNGSPIDAIFLKYLIENCERIMSSVKGDLDVGSTSYLYNPLEDRSPEKVKAIIDDPNVRRSEWMGTSIVYNENKIFKSQL